MLNQATIFRGAFWFFLGAIFGRAIFFLLPIFIAPLGPASLGLFHLSLRIFHSVLSIPANALNILFTHRLRRYLQDPKSLRFEEEAAYILKLYFICGLFLGIFLFVFILLFVPLKSTAILALTLPFALVSIYLTALMKLVQRFEKIFLIQIVSFIVHFLYLVLFISILQMGIAIAFVGQFLISVLTAFLSVIFLFDKLNLLGLFKKIDSSLFAIPFLSIAHILFIALFPMLDLSLVAAFFGLSALGHYVVLLYLPLIIYLIPNTLFGMFVHVASVKSQALEDIAKISKTTFKWVLLLSIPPFVLIMLYPEELLSIIFHESYLKDLQITRLLAISFFIQSISWMATKILIVKRKKLINVSSNYILGSLFVAFAIFLAPSRGVYGIALAYLFYSVLDAMVKYFLCVWTAKVAFIDLNHFKILAAGVAAFILSNMLFSGRVYLFLPVFLGSYTIILWVIRIIKLKSIFELKKIISKGSTFKEEDYEV